MTNEHTIERTPEETARAKAWGLMSFNLMEAVILAVMNESHENVMRVKNAAESFAEVVPSGVAKTMIEMLDGIEKQLLADPEQADPCDYRENRRRLVRKTNFESLHGIIGIVRDACILDGAKAPAGRTK